MRFQRDYVAPGTHVETIWAGGPSVDVDLRRMNSPCAEITCGADGTLVLEDASGAVVTLSVLAGQVIRCQCVRAIAAGSGGAAPLTVIW
jgi:hypothetical protein